ncbi:hypothetical protein EVAR_80783_1 [Eumeta japonica]|uniref:Uncharacterized protein n=1 Tax=Eumeta variegata TaxID=151549 RepID=A0A4C1X6M7_EUMVA|nr:hypothetical protein EVAR_80783_1 [Eumeta japonica]
MPTLLDIVERADSETGVEWSDSGDSSAPLPQLGYFVPLQRCHCCNRQHVSKKGCRSKEKVTKVKLSGC